MRIIVTAKGLDVHEFPGMIRAEQVQNAVMAGADRVRADMADYYGMKDLDEPNRFYAEGSGSRRTHFWGQVQESIRGPSRLSGGGARIEVTDYRIMQKIKGGPIRAKNVRYLTIPIHPEAYARRAGELFSLVGKLFVVTSKRGNLFLCGKDEDKRLVRYYLLKEEVNQKPWPGAIPKIGWIKESFRNGLRYFLRHGLSRGATYG